MSYRYHFCLLDGVQMSLQEEMASIFMIIFRYTTTMFCFSHSWPSSTWREWSPEKKLFPFFTLSLSSWLMATLFLWKWSKDFPNAKNIQRLSQEGSTHETRVAAMWKLNTLSLIAKLQKEKIFLFLKALRVHVCSILCHSKRLGKTTD